MNCIQEQVSVKPSLSWEHTSKRLFFQQVVTEQHILPPLLQGCYTSIPGGSPTPRELPLAAEEGGQWWGNKVSERVRQVGQPP